MDVVLVNKEPDNAKSDPWTRFTFEIRAGSRAATRLRRQVIRVLPDEVCPDSGVRGRQISLAIANSQLERARTLLKPKFRELAELMT